MIENSDGTPPLSRKEEEQRNPDIIIGGEADIVFAHRRAILYRLKEKRIEWYGWNGCPQNPALVREIFECEVRAWCDEHHVVLTAREVTELVSKFYGQVGW